MSSKVVKISKQPKIESVVNEIISDFKDGEPEKIILEEVESLPRIVWGRDYIANGEIPEQKPELISGILRQSHIFLPI
jgi:hypothetical protein